MNALEKDTLELLQATAVAAADAKGKASVLTLPPGSKEYAIIKGSGDIELHELPPRERKHRLYSVQEVPAFVNEIQARLAGNLVTVWYSQEAVTVLIDDGPDSVRTDCARVELLLTKEMKCLRAVAEKWLSQRELIRLLRIDLADSIGAWGAELVCVLRSIDYGESVGGKGKVEHGRESMGREIENEVRSELGAIPETITLSVRLYEDPALRRRFDIRCALELNPRDGLFQLVALPGQISDALEAQMESIGSLLGECVCPVYYGTP